MVRNDSIVPRPAERGGRSSRTLVFPGDVPGGGASGARFAGPFGVPVAERTGLIVPIGRWVLDEACRRAREWQERHPTRAPLAVAVNLSARQLRYPELV